VERITLSEPDSPADHLPVDSGAVDTVVSTLVLCTVADLAARLAEMQPR